MTIHFLFTQAYLLTMDVIFERLNLLVSQFALVRMVIACLKHSLLLLDLLS